MESLGRILAMALMIGAVTTDSDLEEIRVLTERRRDLLKDYNKFSISCPEVDLLLVPLRITVDTYMSQASVDIGLLMTWIDPYLKIQTDAEGSQAMRLLESDVWVPTLMSASSSRQVMAPVSHKVAHNVRNVWVYPATGRVTTYRTTKVRALCEPLRPEDWPRDALNCSFSIGSGAGQRPGEAFSIREASAVDTVCHDTGKDPGCLPMERVEGWRLHDLSSEATEHGMEMTVELHRLAGQFEAIVVFPAPVLSALLLSSLLLPPCDPGRSALLVSVLLLHFLQFVALSFWLNGQAVSSPRLVLLYRESVLLVGLALLQWLLSRALAARKKPLATWMLPAARLVLVLQRPLFIRSEPASLPEKSGECPKVDQQSLALTRVLDRLMFLALTACYIGFLSVQLP